MKNGKSKLKLNRESIVALRPQEMADVNGGIIWTIAIPAVALTLLFCGNNQAR